MPVIVGFAIAFAVVLAVIFGVIWVTVTLLLWTDPLDKSEKDTLTLVEVLRREVKWAKSLPGELAKLGKRIY